MHGWTDVIDIDAHCMRIEKSSTSLRARGLFFVHMYLLSEGS